ncbi:MAG TPA: DsbA family protein [Acidimicrobiales bacterium]|nr:DsbA family protein [Acidimicrobiales bacterium]
MTRSPHLAEPAVDGPAVITLWTDLTCPWAMLAVHRFHAARSEAGLADAVVLGHRAFPLEIINGRPTSKAGLDAEIPVIAPVGPGMGMRVWSAPDAEWPVTSLLALEAVQAVKRETSLAAAEQLDLGLRRAMFCESRCISMRNVILDVAASCELLDVDVLRVALDDGRHRGAVIHDHEEATRLDVEGSPHAFLPDGSHSHNPGVVFHREGSRGARHIVIDTDDEGAWLDLIQRAVAHRALTPARG